MTAEAEINIFRALDFIRDNAPAYAKAKAERVYLEEYRKSKKALLMKSAMKDGHSSVNAQEREAYADEGYMEHLVALSAAVEVEERFRWQMIAAQAKIEVWRTLESTRRIEAKTL
jgi:hypothetical protein